MESAQHIATGHPAPAAGTPSAYDEDILTIAARSADAVLVIDDQGIAQLANAAAEQLFGRPVSDLVGQPFGFPLLAGEATDLEILRPDGSVVFAELRVDPASYRGQPSHVATLHDITGRKRGEQLLIEAQQLLRSALDALSAQIAILDADGTIAAVNDAWRRFARNDAGALVRGTVGVRYLPTPATTRPEQRHLFAGIAAVLRGERERFSAECAIEQDGARHWLALHVASCGEGRWGRAVVAFEEITERKLAERLDAERRHVLELVARQQSIEQVAGAILSLAAERYPNLHYAAIRVPEIGLFCSRSRWLRSAERDTLDQWARELPAPADAAPTISLVHPAHAATLAGIGCTPWLAGLPLGHGMAEGQLLLCRSHGAEPRPEDTRFVELVSQLLTIAVEQYAHNRRLAHQAHHDPLTGLPNRMLFDDRLHQALEVARRSGHMVGVLFIDLDRFKQINDTLGHAAGDALLVQLARRFEGCVRTSDTLARRGGDEFMLVLPEIVSAAQVSRVARRLHDLLRLPFIVEGQELFVSASIGAAVFPTDGEDSATLQRNADTAMYRAKSTLRNSFQFFDANANSTSLERLQLETSLRRAVERQELEIHYQPKVDRHGRLAGAEALLRWNHPDLGFIPPSRFIPLAEELGLIVSIGEWCLAEICRQLGRWQQQGFATIKMAVNISAVQFAQPGFLPMLTQTLARSGIDPSWLELELTESMLMGDVEGVARLLEQLRALRLTLAIDDFGTGYSSLGYLHRLPISVLKVDRSFVGRIGTPEDDGDRGIVSAIITLGHHLHMQLVAEGVETEAQRRFLTETGCDLFQGFLFSRPLPPDRFEQLLQQ